MEMYYLRGNTLLFGELKTHDLLSLKRLCLWPRATWTQCHAKFAILIAFIKPKMRLRRSLYHPEYREKLMEGMECHWHDEVVFTAATRILLRAGLFKAGLR